MYLLTESDMPCYPGFVVESRTDGDPIPIRSTLGYSAEQRDGLKVFGRSQIKVSTIGTKKFEAVSEGELGADYHFLSLENGSTPLIRRGSGSTPQGVRQIHVSYYVAATCYRLSLAVGTLRGLLRRVPRKAIRLP